MDRFYALFRDTDMTVDNRVELPDQPKTTQLDSVPKWAADLSKTSREGFERLDRNLALLSNETVKIRERVAIIEEWRNQADARLTRQSTGVRGLSSTDLAHEAQIFHERDAREKLSLQTSEIATQVATLSKTNEVQLAILSRLDAITSNPLAKTLFAMIATAVMTWLASKGISK